MLNVDNGVFCIINYLCKYLMAFLPRLVSHLTSHNTHQSTEKSVSDDLTFSLIAKSLSRLAKIYSQFSIFKIHGNIGWTLKILLACGFIIILSVWQTWKLYICKFLGYHLSASIIGLITIAFQARRLVCLHRSGWKVHKMLWSELGLSVIEWGYQTDFTKQIINKFPRAVLTLQSISTNFSFSFPQSRDS